MDELAPGLWRWTAPHPDWRAGAKEDSSADWPEAVGCVFAEVRGAPVVIDPLLTSEDQWSALTERLAGRAPHVLTTIRYHRRSREAVLERFGGDEEPPDGVVVHRMVGYAERVLWLEDLRTLVPGDTLIAAEGGGLRVCPRSWLGNAKAHDREELRGKLRTLLELPVEHVIVSHGAPVVGGGHAALAAALA